MTETSSTVRKARTETKQTELEFPAANLNRDKHIENLRTLIRCRNQLCQLTSSHHDTIGPVDTSLNFQLGPIFHWKNATILKNINLVKNFDQMSESISSLIVG